MCLLKLAQVMYWYSLSVHFYCLHGLFSENGSEVSGEGQTGSDPSNADEKTSHGTGGDASSRSGRSSVGNLLPSTGTMALKRGMKHLPLIGCLYRSMDVFNGKGLKKRRRDDDHTGLSTILAGYVAYSEEADAKRRILEAELEEKRREQERKHEERMMQMMMTFMQQMTSNNTRISPETLVPFVARPYIPHNSPYSYPPNSYPFSQPPHNSDEN